MSRMSVWFVTNHGFRFDLDFKFCNPEWMCSVELMSIRMSQDQSGLVVDETVLILELLESIKKYLGNETLIDSSLTVCVRIAIKESGRTSELPKSSLSLSGDESRVDQYSLMLQACGPNCSRFQWAKMTRSRAGYCARDRAHNGPPACEPLPHTPICARARTGLICRSDLGLAVRSFPDKSRDLPRLWFGNLRPRDP